jgi:hypothetical protein
MQDYGMLWKECERRKKHVGEAGVATDSKVIFLCLTMTCGSWNASWTITLSYAIKQNDKVMSELLSINRLMCKSVRSLFVATWSSHSSSDHEA